MALRDLIVKNRNNSVVERSEWVNPFDNIQKEIDRVFSGFFNDFSGIGNDFFHKSGASSFSPKIDVSEDKEGVNIAAELPGMDENDIEVSFKDGRLLIKGEKSHGDNKKEEDYYHVERSYGSFQRSIRVPEEVDSEKIEASFKNGLLRIKLPKSEKEQDKVRRIEVKSA